MKILEKYKKDLDRIGIHLNLLVDRVDSPSERSIDKSSLPKGLTLFTNWGSKETYNLIYYYHGAPLIGLYYTGPIKCLFIPTSVSYRMNDIHSKIFPKENIICKDLEWNKAYDEELIETILDKVLPCTFKKYDARFKIYEQKIFLANQEKEKQKEIKIYRNKEKLKHFLQTEF